MERWEEILHYWFGRIERTVLPSERRRKIWFGGGAEVDAEISTQFEADLNKAIAGEYNHWSDHHHSLLALIILFDQFSRHIFRGRAQAFAQDSKAMGLCLKGIEAGHDHQLSLVERAFYYMPLMHSESLEMQTTSVQAFKMLTDISFTEAHNLFSSFLHYAIKHYEVIKRFGRFPHRNALLGRESTDEEKAYLDKLGPNIWD